MEYQRQGSISHAGGADELDFADLTEQIHEYEKALEERLSDYREDNNENKYEQIQQMINKFGWLSRIALTKGQE